MKIIPYLFFPGTAEDALNMYCSILKGKVAVLQRYSDGPEGMPVPEGMENKLMHGRMQFAGGMIYVSDGHEVKPGATHSLTIEFDDVESLNAAFAQFSEGAKIHWDLQDMFWGARYGKLTDKFGINWDLNYQYPESRDN